MVFDIAAPLMQGLANARDRLTAAAAATARAQTVPGAPQTDAAMADVAERAVFTEALLAATHARLEELKTVTK
ncbi:MAG TPA: hypothetical protein VIG32_04180 [Candidatus Baltobacteraceae bacterium]